MLVRVKKAVPKTKTISRNELKNEIILSLNAINSPSKTRFWVKIVQTNLVVNNCWRDIN